MTFKQSKIFREGKLYAWSYKDIMLGVQTAQLSEGLPTDVKVLICNMSLGFAVHCLAAREAKFDKNGIRNRRDLECLVQKFSVEPRKRQDWTCWPCLDFLRKFKPEVWKHRIGLEIKCNSCWKPLCHRKSYSMLKVENFGAGGENTESAKDGQNPAVIKLRFGEIQIIQNATSHNAFHPQER